MAGSNDTNGDLTAHHESFARFMWWLKFGTVATIVVVAFVIFLLTR